MGGSYCGNGNTGSHSEWNFAIDPEAVDIVFRQIVEKIVIITWEMTFFSLPELVKANKNWFRDVVNYKKETENNPKNRVSTF